MSRRFYGKYRGKVEGNIDPQSMGRLQVSCAAVLGDGRLAWAMPCTPYGGDGVGFFALPPTGANVWVEFEAGNTKDPIWSGCFWSTGEVPATPALPTTKMLKTDAITLTLDDLSGAGGLTLKIAPPAVSVPIEITGKSGSIEIKLGASTIKLDGTKVTVNNGALEVM